MERNLIGNQKDILTTGGVAELLKIDVSTVKRWADSGLLPCTKTLGGHRRYTQAQVREFILRYDLGEIVSADSPQQGDSNDMRRGGDV